MNERNIIALLRANADGNHEWNQLIRDCADRLEQFLETGETGLAATSQPSNLRDWFAGMALQGFCSTANNEGEWRWNLNDAAKASYQVAEAMLKARANHLGRPVAASEPPDQPKPGGAAPGSPQGTAGRREGA